MDRKYMDLWERLEGRYNYSILQKRSIAVYTNKKRDSRSVWIKRQKKAVFDTFCIFPHNCLFDKLSAYPFQTNSHINNTNYT